MAVLKYTMIRLATFFLVFAACLLMEVGMVLALIVGLIGSWAVGYLFFNRLRLEAGAQLARRFGSDERRRSAAEASDNEAEDALADEYHTDRHHAEEGLAEEYRRAESGEEPPAART